MNHLTKLNQRSPKITADWYNVKTHALPTPKKTSSHKR